MSRSLELSQNQDIKMSFLAFVDVRCCHICLLCLSYYGCEAKKQREKQLTTQGIIVPRTPRLLFPNMRTSLVTSKDLPQYIGSATSTAIWISDVGPREIMIYIG